MKRRKRRNNFAGSGWISSPNVRLQILRASPSSEHGTGRERTRVDRVIRFLRQLLPTACRARAGLHARHSCRDLKDPRFSSRACRAEYPFWGGQSTPLPRHETGRNASRKSAVRTLASRQERGPAPTRLLTTVRPAHKAAPPAVSAPPEDVSDLQAPPLRALWRRGRRNIQKPRRTPSENTRFTTSARTYAHALADNPVNTTVRDLRHARRRGTKPTCGPSPRVTRRKRAVSSGARARGGA